MRVLRWRSPEESGGGGGGGDDDRGRDRDSWGGRWDWVWSERALVEKRTRSGLSSWVHVFSGRPIANGRCKKSHVYAEPKNITLGLGLGPNCCSPGCLSPAAPAAAAATWTPPYCTIVAADTSDFSYLSCPLCDRTLPDHADNCAACSLRGPAPVPAHVYRLLLSVATHDRVIPVVLFDRAAHALLGCPADELAGFFAAHPGTARAAAEPLQGKMCRMALRASKKGTAERLRAVSVAPFRDGFRPVIGSLRSLYPRGG